MTVRELNIGDVFRVVGETVLWRKANQREAHQTGPPVHTPLPTRAEFGFFRGKEIEIVERAGEICRTGDTLVLRGGEVTLEYHGAWPVYRCTPGDPFTEFALTTRMLWPTDTPTEDTALAFAVGTGAKHLGRAKGSDILAYKGRVYARATNRDVLGKATAGSYKRLKKIDGAKRLVIVGILTIPNEFALYDIIMEHFGPDTVPR